MLIHSDSGTMRVMQDWEALAAAMRRRRAELLYTNRAKLMRDKGLTMTQYRLLMDMENGKRNNFDASTLGLVEVVYEWQPGSVKDILDGLTPTPVPRESLEYAAHPPLLKDAEVEAPPTNDMERLIADGFAQQKANTEAMERRLSERLDKVERRLDERP